MASLRTFESLRLRWPAALVDLATATVCVLVAYNVRFGGADVAHFLDYAFNALVGIVGVHLLLLAALGLYSTRGLRLWPVRLIGGTALSVALALLVAVLTSLDGVSRQAIVVYGVLFVIAGIAWRALVGLAVQYRRQKLIEAAEPGLEVRGAHYQSLGGGLLLAWRYRHLIRNLVARDLQLKYRGSVLGFVWSLVNPLVMIAVYTFAFRYVLNVQTPRYTSFVLIGIVTWGFFSGTMLGSTASITGSGSLLQSVLFPRAILPIAGVLFNLAQFLLTIVVFLPLLFILDRTAPGPQTMLFPIFLVLQVLFFTGAALVLSTATVYFRDVQQLVEIGLSAAFWATPILYEYTFVPERFRFAILMTPMAPFVRAYQDIFHYQVWPDWSVSLLAAAYGISLFVAGLSVFVTYEESLAEQV